jgi:hypothetical protein
MFLEWYVRSLKEKYSRHSGRHRVTIQWEDLSCFSELWMDQEMDLVSGRARRDVTERACNVRAPSTVQP